MKQRKMERIKEPHRKRQRPLQVLSDIRIRLPAQLRLPLQRLGRIEPVHHDLHELDSLARSEGRCVEELVELLLRVDSVRLRAGLEVGGGEDVEKLRPFPVRGKK